MKLFSFFRPHQTATRSTHQSRRQTSSRRQLIAERLEARLCFSAVRIVAWNTENGPDGAADEADFRTVFQAIGNETVAGNTLPPSIVGLQETDNDQSGGDSIERVEAVLKSLYPSTNFAHAVSSLDSGGDANGFVYDDDLFDLISTSVVDETPGMTRFAHNIFRGQFRPLGTTGPSDFYLYSTHLKAGSSDTVRREAEATAIRVDMDALGANQEIIVMGDFNIQSSSEGAYVNFLASGNGQLFDPIDTPGNWNNNFAFKSIHTQNPEVNGAGGLDSRFDFQLGTAAVFENEGLQYIPDSYHAFGNNGTHTFNSDITTGTGASPAIMAALAAASDHLPVVADYELGISLNRILVVESGGTTSVTEGGSGDSYTVSLDSVPTSNVTLTITSDDQSLVNGSASTSFIFTPGNALSPRTVLVTAADDSVVEGFHQSVIIHTTSSSDGLFDDLTPQALQLDVIDNDGASSGSGGVVISEIMYNPRSAEPAGEWVEIVNINAGSVDLSGWLLDDEDAADWSAIPTNTPLLPGGGVAVIYNNEISLNAFRNAWSIPPSIPLIGVSWGSLANSPSMSSEILELLDSSGEVQDTVNFDESDPWPAGNGFASLYLTGLFVDNNAGSNWALSSFGVNNASSPLGTPFSVEDVGSPGSLALAADFGDAPSPYLTLYAANGASHLAIGPRLGATRDLELDGIVSALADGDDNGGIDDEDGVMFGDIVLGNSVAAVNITLEEADDAKVDAWIDFNQDGDWDDLNEQVLNNIPINRGLQTLNYDLPAGVIDGETFARVRVSSIGGLASSGPAADGEVEDVRVTIVTPVVESIIVNGGQLSRSELTSIDVQFDSLVTLISDNFQLRDIDTNELVEGLSVSTIDIGDQTLATLTFTTGTAVIESMQSGVLSTLDDGRYELGYVLDGMMIDRVDTFFRKYGDVDQSDSVGLSDFAAFRAAFGSSFEADSSYESSLDANRDGTISLADFASFRSEFGN